MAFSRLLLVAALASLVLVTGCNTSGRLRYDTPQDAFQKGMDLYERGRFQRAAEYFQGVFDFGRMNEMAADAQLYLARAYNQDKQYILATSEYTRFIDLYRNDPRVEEAEFERAGAYYALSPRYELDQTDTERAIDFYQLFINRHRQSEKVAEAEARIQELREKLAHKQYATAGLYERRGLWEAAAVSFESAFDRYPDTEWADEALIGAIRSFINFADVSIQARQAERYERAITNYDRLVQLFPGSPYLEEGKELYERARERRDRIVENL